MLNKDPTQITEDDLLALIADEEPEGRTIDYKRGIVGDTSDAKKEFLYDISSFANARGGYLVFGMEEANGLPTKLGGLSNVDPDAEILRLEHMARDGIRPPIAGLQSAAVKLVSGNVALVMRVPKSWNPPHQVTFQKAFRFYSRDSNGKYQIDVDELRAVFVLSASAAEAMRLFRINRIGKVVGGNAPVSLDVGAKMIVHLLPFSAFAAPQQIDVQTLWGNPAGVVGVMRGGGTPTMNLDGLLLASPTRPAPRYAQVFRNGCVEVVSGWSGEANSRNSLPCPAFETALIEHLYRAKQLFGSIGVAPPIAVMVTFTGVDGWNIATQWDSSAARFDRDPVVIPELVLESFDGIVQNEIKPILDMIWNAAGSVGSPNYDGNGHYKS
jgi:hypothetical protein